MTLQLGAPASAVRAHEEMFSYWASRKCEGRLPGREQIHPKDFKRHLPTVSLIDVIRDKQTGERTYRQRLAGTGLYSVYGREITGRLLEDVYSEEAARYWTRELDKVVESRRPAVGFHGFDWRGHPHTQILWLRMPLASNGREVDMILGYDALVAGQSDLTSGIRAA